MSSNMLYMIIDSTRGLYNGARFDGWPHMNYADALEIVHILSRGSSFLIISLILILLESFSPGES